jgi:dGTPase
VSDPFRIVEVTMNRLDPIPALAHAPLPVTEPGAILPDRVEREEREAVALAPHATRASGAGRRAVPEQPDRYRTCFERDLDRIHHSKAFRRLAGKCQVFVAPEDDHLRTRLTHAIEVCQVAVSIARPTGLNLALTAAAATGHDCGHGPAGHASEGALSPFVEGGYHHAVYGADVVLAPLNLCEETLDAIRNHSWNRPAPATPEGEVVAWADRIAYVCHDFEDAVDAGVVAPDDLPSEVRDVVGSDRRAQLHGFITAMVQTIADTGAVGLRQPEADALAAFRAFNYERIYLRPEAVEQADRSARLIGSLCEHYLTHPSLLPEGALDDGEGPLRPGSPAATAAAVRYVSGMTDRFAHRAALDLLGWDERFLPRTA